MNSYLLFKSLHLIAVISWMVGLLYLPRIFVYHVENLNDKNTCLAFKTMESKLFFYIMTPAMILTWLFGLILIHVSGLDVLFALWIKLKILFIILLTLYHFYLARCLNDFKLEQNTKTSKFFRIINECPQYCLFSLFLLLFLNRSRLEITEIAYIFREH